MAGKALTFWMIEYLSGRWVNVDRREKISA
jgi:hypothetical protein